MAVKVSYLLESSNVIGSVPMNLTDQRRSECRGVITNSSVNIGFQIYCDITTAEVTNDISLRRLCQLLPDIEPIGLSTPRSAALRSHGHQEGGGAGRGEGRTVQNSSRFSPISLLLANMHTSASASNCSVTSLSLVSQL